MKNMPPLIIAIDLGTTTVKVGLFEISGKLKKIAKREQVLIFPKPGWVEQSLSSTLELVIECIHELMVEKNEIRAISISAQRGSIVPLASDGTPLSNLIVWMDERGVPFLEIIKQRIRNNDYYNISGHPVTSITGISKILWLKEKNQELYDKCRVIGNQQTYLLKWLGCEELIIDKSVGSLFFPLNIRKKTWSTEIANKLELPLSKLPKLVNGTEIAGVLSEKAAKILGLKKGTPLVPGGGDGQCAGLGSAITKSGVAMVNIGTSTGIQVFSKKPYFDLNQIINCASHVPNDAWELECHTQASGSVFKWFRDEIAGSENHKNNSSYDDLINETKKILPGSSNLIFIPTFFGSTAPIIDPSARGVLFGLSLHHKRSHIIKSLLEGISFEIRWMIESLEKTSYKINEIRLVGGGASNDIWNQIHSNIYRKKISTITNSEASLTGAAMCAAIAIEIYSDFDESSQEFVKLLKNYYPDPKTSEIYDSIFNHYQKLFLSLSENKLFF